MADLKLSCHTLDCQNVRCREKTLLLPVSNPLFMLRAHFHIPIQASTSRCTRRTAGHGRSSQAPTFAIQDVEGRLIRELLVPAGRTAQTAEIQSSERSSTARPLASELIAD